MKTKIPTENIEGERNDLYVYNKGFKAGQQEEREKVLELIDEHIKRAKVGYCNINCLEELKQLISKLEDDEVK